MSNQVNKRNVKPRQKEQALERKLRKSVASSKKDYDEASNLLAESEKRLSKQTEIQQEIAELNESVIASSAKALEILRDAKQKHKVARLRIYLLLVTFVLVGVSLFAFAVLLGDLKQVVIATLLNLGTVFISLGLTVVLVQWLLANFEQDELMTRKLIDDSLRILREALALANSTSDLTSNVEQVLGTTKEQQNRVLSLQHQAKEQLEKIESMQIEFMELKNEHS